MLSRIEVRAWQELIYPILGPFLVRGPHQCSLPLCSGSAVEREYKVELGRDAHLPCEYSPPKPPTPLVPVCWGRGACPLSDCQRLLLRTNGRSVQQRAHSRYQLKGQLYQGDVSLTIQGAWLNDSGTYCCRIQFPGPMNDKKVILKLTVKPGLCSPQCL